MTGLWAVKLFITVAEFDWARDQETFFTKAAEFIWGLGSETFHHGSRVCLGFGPGDFTTVSEFV